MRTILRLSAAALAGLLCATMSVATISTPASASSAGRHCVVRLSSTSPMSCFSTFTQAIEAATYGKVTGAPADPAGIVHDPAFRETVNKAATPRPQSGVTLADSKSDTIVGIEYQHINLTGNTFTFTATWGCTSSVEDVDYEYSYWRTDWDNVVSSFAAYSNCWMAHYDHPFWYTGQDYLFYQPTAYYIGAWMNDRTSSVRWS